MKINSVKIGLPSSLLALAASANAAIIIDDFNDSNGTPQSVTRSGALVTNDSGNNTRSDLDGVIGRTRNLTVTRTAVAATGLGSRSVAARVDDNPNQADPEEQGLFNFESGTRGNGRATLLYGGPGNLLNVNFSNESFFTIDFGSYDAPQGLPLAITLGLTSALEGTTPGSSTAMASFGDENGILNIPFSSFMGNVNFSDIDEISVRLDPNRGGDFSIDSISVNSTAVPEPSSSLFLGALILSGALARRRKS